MQKYTRVAGAAGDEGGAAGHGDDQAIFTIFEDRDFYLDLDYL